MAALPSSGTLGRLKLDYGFGPLRVRGLERVALHAELTSLPAWDKPSFRAQTGVTRGRYFQLGVRRIFEAATVGFGVV